MTDIRPIDHIYVRYAPRLEIVRHRHGYSPEDTLRAVNEGAQYGLVLAVLSKPGAYDVVKSEGDTLERLINHFEGRIEDDYLVFDDPLDDEAFRKSWQDLQPA
jgi:hypothetical protein